MAGLGTGQRARHGGCESHCDSGGESTSDRREAAEIIDLHFGDNLLWPYIIGNKANVGFTSFQTFSLDAAAELLITGALLDRFLACMKPASIT